MKYYDSQLYWDDIDKCIREVKHIDNLRGKTILITGASGMIGSFLVDVCMYYNHKYDANISIYAVSRTKSKLTDRFAYWEKSKKISNLKFIVADVTSLAMEESLEVDFYVCAASNTHPIEYALDPIGTIMTNVLGTYNVLQLATLQKKKKARVLLLSTVEVYGEPVGTLNAFSEMDMGYLNCNDLRAGYPESKRVSEALLQAFIAKNNVDALSVRLCRIYGPTVEQDDRKASSQFINNAVKGEEIVLKSEGKQCYSYLYITDAATAILSVLFDGKTGEVYNVSDERSDVSLKQFAQILSDLSGNKIRFDLPNEIEQQGFSKAMKAILDSTKLKNIGWESLYDIETGLKRTVNILKDNF